MPVRSTFRPVLELLEGRYCPSLTIQTFSGNLLISGTPTGASGLNVTGMAGKYQVMDGTHILGTYSASNITLNLQSYSEPITVDLGTQTLGGNLLLNVGLGNVSGSPKPILIEDGAVGGSITLTGGTGNEQLQLGALGGGADTLHVGGSVQFVGHNGFGGNSNILDLFDGSSVGGSISATLVTTVEIGVIGTATVGNGLTVNDSGAATEMTVELNGTSTVGGNVSITGTSQFVLLGDFFAVQPGVTIRGNVTANLGDNVNDWVLSGTFDGTVNLSGGGGVEPGFLPLNTVELDSSATFNGNVNVTTGSGSTELIFQPGSTVNGNLSLNLGNGNNDLGGGAFGGMFSGSVFGNVSIHLGNGSDSTMITNAPSGLLTYSSGNGADSLTLSPATAGQVWNVNATFGNNDDTFTLAGPNGGFLTGSVDGGGRINGNVFSQDPSWTLLPPFQLSNFP